MNLTLGKYHLSVSRQPPAERQTLPAIITGLPSAQPLFFNRYDSPRTNLEYIRETVSACMHARSEAISRGKLHAYRDGRTSPTNVKQPLPATHPLERLLRHPNPIFDMSDLLELSSQWLDATGNALWLKVRDQDDEPVELWPVAALSYFIERGDDGMPGYYRFPETNARIPARDMIHIRRADIRTAPFDGHAILSDILETAKADTAIRLFQSRFFENDATPRAVFTWPVGARVTQDQLDHVRDLWNARYRGAENAGKLGFLTEGAHVQLLGAGAKELDFARSKKELRDTIREAFRVPQIVLGDVESVNLSNAETSYQVFLRDVVDHALSKHARALTRALANEWSESITIEHDSVVPESEEQFLARLRELKDSLTVDEKRALLGHGPVK
jgi:HK97 family phage portal protein